MQTMNALLHAPLDAALIAGLSHAAGHGLVIEVVGETASTNADLRARLDQMVQPVVRAAERQTAGRGRAGRNWQSAAGQSLCFSLAWRFEKQVSELIGLPLAVGVVLAETLGRHGWPVQLKWPNDLLKDGAKLGGILIETASLRDQAYPAAWAVIGIGINIHDNGTLSNAIGSTIATLDTAPVDRNALLAELVDALVAALPVFERDALAPFLARWHRLHAHADRPVVILEAGRVVHEGIARGIDQHGCLLLETAASAPQCMSITAGDVSLRAQSFGAHHAAD